VPSVSSVASALYFSGSGSRAQEHTYIPQQLHYTYYTVPEQVLQCVWRGKEGYGYIAWNGGDVGYLLSRDGSKLPTACTSFNAWLMYSATLSLSNALLWVCMRKYLQYDMAWEFYSNYCTEIIWIVSENTTVGHISEHSWSKGIVSVQCGWVGFILWTVAFIYPWFGRSTGHHSVWTSC
jgi:hypothetical protein